MTQTRKSDHPSDSKKETNVPPIKVFVVSPIGSAGTETHRKATYALEYVIRQALPRPAWDVHRADEGTSPGSISHHVIDNIAKADLVVVDLTDHNPNVFYELAIAHGWKKPVVHIIEDGQKIPFDVIDQRTIPYDLTDLKSVSEAIKSISKAAEWALSNKDEIVTPMKQYEMFSVSTASGNDPATVQTLQFDELIRRIGGLERAIYKPQASTRIFETKKSGLGMPREVVENFVDNCISHNTMSNAESLGPDQAEEFNANAMDLITTWSILSETEKQFMLKLLRTRRVELPSILQ